MSALINPFAFSAPPPTNSTWDPGNVDPSIVLSNSNRTLTGSGGSSACGKNTASRSSGKLYYEITINGGTAAASYGIGTASAANSAQQVGAGSGALGGWGNGLIKAASSLVDTWTKPTIAGQVVALAIDLTGHLFWITTLGTGGVWNSAGDPSSATGGVSFLAGTYFIMGGGGSASDLTLNTGGSAFSGSLPTGFSAWG